MPSTNNSHSHSHSHSHSRTDTQPSPHKPHASKKTPPKSLPSPLPPQTTSKSQHDNNITDIVPPSRNPTPALTLPPPTTEATLCASIRLQSRLSDLLETARLFVEFDEGTKNSEAYYDLTYFYHRELKHSVLAVLRALHQLADRIAEGIESPSGDGEDPPDSTDSTDSKDARKSRDAKLLALVPKALREACLEIKREIGEVRERRKETEWKELGREGRRKAWRGHCERLVRGVEGSRGAREREVERLRGELRGEVRRLVKGE